MSRLQGRGAAGTRHLVASALDSATARVYLRYSRAKTLFLLSALLGLAVLAVFAIRLGATGLGYGEILSQLARPDGSWNATVVWKLRLPRIVAAMLAGGALGLAGAVMQSILRNPMASPFTLGLSNAAAFGAALAIVAFDGGRMVGSVQAFSMISNPLIVTLSAFACSLAATLVILGLISLTECSPETMVLTGLAISAIFGTGLALLTFLADDVAIASIVFWQFGSLGKADWGNAGLVAILLALSFLYFFLKRWDYNAMEAGEDVAKGLGVRIRSTRMLGLCVSALLTASVVSFFGIIGFIGLIGPHMVKRLIGNDSRFVLPGSALVGALVLLLAHVVSSYAFDIAVPVGIITSAVGGPLFLLILLRGGRR